MTGQVILPERESKVNIIFKERLPLPPLWLLMLSSLLLNLRLFSKVFDAC